jgi:hypothetical protein
MKGGPVFQRGVTSEKGCSSSEIFRDPGSFIRFLIELACQSVSVGGEEPREYQKGTRTHFSDWASFDKWGSSRTFQIGVGRIRDQYFANF